MTDNISGSERAAIFMMSLGEHGAAEVLKHMGPKEVQEIGSAMASLNNVSNEKVHAVLGEFAEILQGQSAVGVDSIEYVRKVLIGALGEDKATGLLDRILEGKTSKGLESLKWMDPRVVAEVISNEHPQIIAIVLSTLESDHAAEILMHVPENSRSDVVMRIATLDNVSPNALDDLNEVLEKQLTNSASSKSMGVGGIKTAASILNLVDSDTEAAITASITEKDAELAEEISDKMFVFENLLAVDDRGIQSILREVQSDTLIVALKGADDAMKDKIFGNMSSRAAEMMREDLDAKGPVRLKDVEVAQKEILDVAARMAEAGDISLGGKGDDEYV
ncbi:MAG: flagellar motor switch protein FliG [Gammaproteobacteria bacterium]